MRKLLILNFIFISVITGIKSFAQETTATVNGTVADEKNNAVAGASIVLKHEPTGTVYYTQTNSRGIFVAPNLKVGGPYTISITYVGYNADTLHDVNLVLGNNPDLNVGLQPLSNTLTEVTVSASGRRNTGSGIIVGRQQLNTLPTIGRSLNDFTRLTPQSNNNSFAGSNFRYNNFTLDGAINNDAIGFSNSFGGVSGGGQSGTAGSGTRTNPYSLETIQEVQVQLTPYDVKIGNFTGGSVNAVTKSGTNDFHGSVYGFGRNQDLVGKSVDGLKTSIGSDFHDYQTGFTLGGPIVKNKLFFFVNAELTRQQTPTFYNAGDPGAAASLADVQQIASFLKANYNYDPGTYGKYKIFTKSNKFFGKLDWNINSKNTLMLRGVYTKGWGNNLERTSTNFQFSSTDFTQYDNNLNLVAELNSRISNKVNNQAIVSYINVHEYRTFPGSIDASGTTTSNPSAFMDIDNGRIWLGTWREASIYNMHQKTFEFTDNVTLTSGINKFTFGTHNEFYDLTYGFLNSFNGRWEYAGGLNSFLASQPSRIRGAYAFDDTKNNRDGLYDNLPGSNYKVNLTSVYAEDELALTRKLKITPGVRLDYPFLNKNFPTDTSLHNTPDYVSTTGATYSHTSFSDIDNKWLGNVSVSPRLGFNWNIKGDQSLVLRGGTGIFVGRMPFAWLGYASTLTGSNYGNIDYKPKGATVPLAIDPSNLKDTVTKYGTSTASSTRELDIVDNNFKLPTIWRSNIALDVKFGNGYKATFDAMYTKTIYDVQFQQINIKDSAVYYSTGPTQTPIYVGGKLNSQYSNIYFLTNTKQGYRYNLTAQLSKTTNNIRMGVHSALNLNWSAAYTYGMSKDVSNGIRNSFQSNYELNPSINSENPGLAYSNFDLRHRVVGSISTNWMWSEHNITSLAFFYSGQTGNPYSLIYTNAPFGNSSNAPLPFIPADQSQINLADYTRNGVVYTAAQQWADLNNFISNDAYLSKHRGEYAKRNALHTPWNNELDMKLMHEFKFKGSQSLQISFDVFNVLNLINNDWGHITFVTNVNNYTVNFLKFANYVPAGTPPPGIAPGAPSTGYIPTFNFLPPANGAHYYTNDPINSRWQAQLGLKYTF